MSVVAMESQYMKTIMIHLVDKSNFILSDDKTRCKFLQLFWLSLQSLRTVIFLKLSLHEVSISRKYKSSQEISTILCELVC